MINLQRWLAEITTVIEAHRANTSDVIMTVESVVEVIVVTTDLIVGQIAMTGTESLDLATVPSEGSHTIVNETTMMAKSETPKDNDDTKRCGVRILTLCACHFTSW